MDSTLQKITDFTFQLGYADLTPKAIHECKRRIIDSLAQQYMSFGEQVIAGRTTDAIDTLRKIEAWASGEGPFTATQDALPPGTR